MTRNSVQFQWQDSSATGGFRNGVSLHSHTMHSHESLGFIPRLVRRVPLLSREFDRQWRRYVAFYGKPPDFDGAYWTPPLAGREAFELERTQIEDGLGLGAIVSLTDHDNIEAGSQLQVLEREIPVSVEWTIPFGETYFHLGVHNLPHPTARDTMSALSGYTQRPNQDLLLELLTSLCAEPGVLIVLNHPMWDQAVIGATRHQKALRNLLDSVGGRIHALELNGLRQWGENRMVVELAKELNRTVISGGDRHGREPNAIINLTNAATFAEFADEVRSGCSHVLHLAQYREPLGLRILQTICDVVSESPDLVGREKWTDRVFFTPRGDGIVPLSSHWKGKTPAVIRWFVRGVQMAGSHRVRRVLRFCLHEDREFAV